MNGKEKKTQDNLPFFGIGKILPYLKNYRREIIGMAVLSALGSVVDVAAPVFQRYSLNVFVATGDLHTLPLYILVYFGIIVFAAVMNYYAGLWGMYVEVGVDKDLRNEAFSHLQTLSFSYFNQNSVGYLHARIINDTGRIGVIFSWGLLNAIWQLCAIVGSVFVMFWIMSCIFIESSTFVPEKAHGPEQRDPGT